MTAHVLSRQQSPDLTLIALVVELCAAACQVCAAECDRHAEHHAHCQVCAAACHRCFEGCRELMTGPAPDRYLHH
ncbi:MAG TPA: hypothetical protein VFQ53_26660 [Kofleriaceae bacterium]|nr:hypothetical protein [Kofleriaceae bacterium]